jgi:hypothetical protein
MDAAISEKLQTEELKLSFIYDSKITCIYGKTDKGKVHTNNSGKLHRRHYHVSDNGRLKRNCIRGHTILLILSVPPVTG